MSIMLNLSDVGIKSVFLFLQKQFSYKAQSWCVCVGFFFQNVPLVFLEKIVPKNVTLHARGVTL